LSIILDMEKTPNPEGIMTKAEMIAAAEKLEQDADNLYISLLAPSMAERGMREDAKALREQAARS